MNIDPRLPEKSIFRFTWQKKMEKKHEKYMDWQIHCVCYAVRIEKHETSATSLLMRIATAWMNEIISINITFECILRYVASTSSTICLFQKHYCRYSRTHLIWLIRMFDACPFFSCDHIILCTLLDIEENIFRFAFGNEHFSNKLFTLLMLLIHFFGPYSIEIVSNWVPFRYYSIIVWCACFHRE